MGDIFARLTEVLFENQSDDRSLAMYVKNSTRDTWELIDGKVNEGDHSWVSIPQTLEPGKEAALSTANNGPGNSASATIIYKKQGDSSDTACCKLRYSVNSFTSNQYYDTGVGEGYTSQEGPKTPDTMQDWWSNREYGAYWREILSGVGSNHIRMLVEVFNK